MTIKIIQGDRRAGKTEQCIRWLMQDPAKRVVITCNSGEADRVAKECARRETGSPRPHKLGAQYWRQRVIDAGQLHHIRGREITIMFDNIDMILRQLVTFNTIAGMTTTEPFEIEQLSLDS